MGSGHDHDHHAHAAQGPQTNRLPGIRHLVAVGSGKGGVGKSTVAVNLALSLQKMGYRVGVLDADVLGPSVHTMLGVREAKLMQLEDKIIPAEGHGLKTVSMGLLTGDDKPAILRGPMLLKYLTMFLRDTAWGELDYLILDLPPGTGDVQLTLAQSAPLTGAVVVTTPQDVSLNIARRGLRMFETVKVPILGIVENMSGFVCPHCNQETPIFRSGGGEKLSRDLEVPFLGSIPLDPEIVSGGDIGRPVVIGRPESVAAIAYEQIARQLVANLAGTPHAVLDSFVWKWEAGAGSPPWQAAAVDEHGRPTTPVGLKKVDPKRLAILWQDGKQHVYDTRDLRLACECAACKDEVTSKPILDPKKVPLDVAPRVIASVGNYAITFQWSDGHTTGIYTWDLLRRMGDKRVHVSHEV